MESDSQERTEVVKREDAQESEEVRSLRSTLRFLVSNNGAGSIIGKGGVVITEFQAQSGAKIVVSRAREFFPGTSDRIILLSGTVSAILTALHLILSKLAELEEAHDGAREGGEGKPAEGGGSNARMDLRIVVPNKVCGAIIGKGGATIRSFVEDSQATIKLSSQEYATSGLAERTVTLGGTLEQKLRAVALLLTKMSEDPSYVQYASVPLSHTASGGVGGPPPMVGAGGYMGGGGYGGHAGMPPYGMQGMPGMPGMAPVRGNKPMAPPPNALTTTIIVAVPDAHVGSVVGKGGRALHDIQQGAGVRMQISDRGDYVEGTSDRKVTITGTAEAVVSAQHLIAQKVQQSIAQSDRKSVV